MSLTRPADAVEAETDDRISYLVNLSHLHP